MEDPNEEDQRQTKKEKDLFLTKKEKKVLTLTIRNNGQMVNKLTEKTPVIGTCTWCEHDKQQC